MGWAICCWQKGRDRYIWSKQGDVGRWQFVKPVWFHSCTSINVIDSELLWVLMTPRIGNDTLLLTLCHFTMSSASKSLHFRQNRPRRGCMSRPICALAFSPSPLREYPPLWQCHGRCHPMPHRCSASALTEDSICWYPSYLPLDPYCGLKTSFWLLCNSFPGIATSFLLLL